MMRISRSMMVPFLVLLFVCLLVAMVRLEYFSVGPRALAYPTKSVDGEAILTDDYAWFAQPTKCFSCQREILRNAPQHPELVYKSMPTKCFSCEGPERLMT